jgi:hypothetical protein
VRYDEVKADLVVCAVVVSEVATSALLYMPSLCANGGIGRDG